METFIREDEIEALIDKRPPTSRELDGILKTSKSIEGITLEEAAALLNVEGRDEWEEIYRTAGEVKEKVFGKRIVLFAPLYLSNYCINNCIYCGFRSNNKDAVRKRLSIEEAVKEADSLFERGYKRLLLVTGEDHAGFGIDDICKAIEAIYSNTGIRILHLNAPPMDVDGFRVLKATGVGVYQLFQETYHRETYGYVHPSGRKRDYLFRLMAMDRAIEAGFKDVGIGVLLGLHDYRFDIISAIAHSHHLYKRFNTHAHTLSLPRLRPAHGAILDKPRHMVSDEDMKRIVAVCRLALPSVGIVITTRESAELRSKLIRIGASQISAGSKTEPGGYIEGEKGSERQFEILDERSIDEVIDSLIEGGHLPSLCTTCYRVGRTGDVFTRKTLRGEMERLCSANAILTLKEYLLDHARNGLMEKGEEVIKRSLREIQDTNLRGEVIKRLKAIEMGERDIYF